MSLLNDLIGLSADNTTQAKTEKSSFKRDGYFAWDEDFLYEPNIAIGVILPPYKEWITERAAAAKAGQPWKTPWALRIGTHGVGIANKDKVYTECRRCLVRDNHVGDGYPLLDEDVVSGGDECPICAVAWDQLWPKVEEFSRNKDSVEYRQWKAAHKAAVPQQKYLVNFLPVTKKGQFAKAVKMSMAKSVYDALESIHLDKMQPDLLWPTNVPGRMSSFVRIQRIESADNQPTKYQMGTIWVGQPHVFEVQGENRVFDEKRYFEILGGMTDLRIESKSLIPEPAKLVKAQQSLERILAQLPGRVQVHNEVVARTTQASAGMPGMTAESSLPTAAIPPTMGLPPSMQQTTPVAMPTFMSGVPMTAPTPIASTPVVQSSPSTPAPQQTKDQSLDLLNSLLNSGSADKK